MGLFVAFLFRDGTWRGSPTPGQFGTTTLVFTTPTFCPLRSLARTLRAAVRGDDDYTQTVSLDTGF